MEFGSFEEFWAALGRLYDANVKNAEEIRELRASVGDLREAAAHLASAVERDHAVIMEHERRHDRPEVTVEAILEDLRRHREGRSPQ
jgi:hypothetical protein